MKESEARKEYDAIAKEVDSRIAQYQGLVQQLLDFQGRKVSSFNGLLGREESLHVNGTEVWQAAMKPMTPANVKNIADAILAIWSLDKYNDALTTEEIAEVLPDTGYQNETPAADFVKVEHQPVLAKLCRTAKVIRYRSDGTRISPKDNKSRARKYISALKAPESEVPVEPPR